MKRFLKIIKLFLYSILGLLLLLFLVAVLFINLSPQFGAAPSKAQKAEYAKTDHWADGKFKNQIPSEMDIDYPKTLREWFKKDPARSPARNVEVLRIPAEGFNTNNNPRLTWFGHSAFLLEMDSKVLLLDPMLGKVPSPHPWLGSARYNNEMPLSIAAMPQIDAVIISHDHYDHLDYGSIDSLKNKVKHFFVPLGVENHLISWGVDAERITVLDWGQETTFEGIELACTPSRHFSGRGLFDRASTLWCSWVIKGKDTKIFFSGDSGYGPHFKEIGQQHGPFDIALMECGQYNEDWHAIHMMPEETAQAGIDVQAKLIMPIHWGAFTLSLHSWTDPVERVIKKADELGIAVTTPAIGEPLLIEGNEFPHRNWWKEFE